MRKKGRERLSVMGNEARRKEKSFCSYSYPEPSPLTPLKKAARVKKTKG